MQKIHIEVFELMGKVDIDCRDEKGTIVIDFVNQLDVYNSNGLKCLIDVYIERRFKNVSSIGGKSPI